MNLARGGLPRLLLPSRSASMSREAINGDVELGEAGEKTGTWKWLSIPTSSTGERNLQRSDTCLWLCLSFYGLPAETGHSSRTSSVFPKACRRTMFVRTVSDIGYRHSVCFTPISLTIQFQANKLPDVNKVFLIGNKQYLCEKIETEIDVDG